jgi:transcriptional regulator with XRE-family HTH domain
MEFKDKIKNRRLELGLTLEEIAEKTGVTAPTIQRYESGEIKNMRRDKVAKLAIALNLSPAYLMGWESEDTAPTDVPMERTDNTADTIITLDKKENTLISLYRQLNSEGQDILVDTADTLVSSKKYQECNTIQDEKQA